MVNHTVLC